MNLRQQILNVLQGEKPDQVAWFGDLDYWYSAQLAQGRLPQKYLGDGILQLHHDLGVGFYLQGYYPFQSIVDGLKVSVEETGQRRTTEIITPAGRLRSVEIYIPESFCWAYQERLIKSWRDLDAYHHWLEHVHYLPDYAKAFRRKEMVGEQGVVLCYLPHSPFMELLTAHAGISTLVDLLQDAPEAFDATIRLLESKYEEASWLAVQSPAECLMIPENLSSEVVGKRLYRTYMESFERRWVDRIRAAGKYSFIHMDGTLRGLIKEVSAVGFNVLEALTPAPVGDLPMGELRNWVTPETIIWGGIPGLYFTDLVDDQEFDRFVIEILDICRRSPNHVLGVADQVPPPARWERILRVRELVDQYGTILY